MTNPHLKVNKALIATTGKTPDPIVATITEHAPDAVILIASQETLAVVSTVMQEYPELTYQTVLVDDPESLVAAFRAARECLSIAKKWEASAILADISGGTKPMTAGVTLALAGLGITFSYVGGTKRDEHGRVVPGHEQVRLLEDPTERFHLSAWRSFKSAWNAWRMDSALEAARRILANEASLSPSEKRFYTNLAGITQGMAAWDRFHHAEALALLRKHLPVALAIAEAWRHGAKVRVLSALETQLAFLERTARKANKPTMNLLADLLANAERRAQTGRYDDAVARLYRALELAAEADLYQRTGVILKNPDTWPESIPADLRERASNLLGLASVLDLAFDLDLRLGHQGTLAQKLRARVKSDDSVLKRRHESILAHGTRPIHEDDYLAFRSIFAELGLKPAQPWPRW